MAHATKKDLLALAVKFSLYFLFFLCHTKFLLTPLRAQAQ